MIWVILKGLGKVHCFEGTVDRANTFDKNKWTLTNLQYIYIYPCKLMYVSQRLKMGKNGTTPKGLFDVCQPRS
jgi:hypothetical protein